MSEPVVIVNQAGGIATVTLNRPEKLNSLNRELRSSFWRVMPGGGMTARLPRAVVIRKAKELSLTGYYLGAREAERMGLVNRVVAPGEALREPQAIAAQILSANQSVVRQLKRLYDLTTRATLHDAIRIEQDFFRAYNSAANLKDFDRQ